MISTILFFQQSKTAQVWENAPTDQEFRAFSAPLGAAEFIGQRVSLSAAIDRAATIPAVKQIQIFTVTRTIKQQLIKY